MQSALYFKTKSSKLPTPMLNSNRKNLSRTKTVIKVKKSGGSRERSRGETWPSKARSLAYVGHANDYQYKMNVTKHNDDHDIRMTWYSHYVGSSIGTVGGRL